MSVPRHPHEPATSHATAAELRVDRGELATALKTLAKRLRRKQHVEVLLEFEDGLLRIETADISVMARAEGEWPGRARLHHGFLLALAEDLPAGDPVRMRVEDARLVVGPMRMSCVWQPAGKPVSLPVPPRPAGDPTLRDLLTLSRHFTDVELHRQGWFERVAAARQEKNERVRRAAELLAPLGISSATLRELVDRQLNRPHHEVPEDGSDE